MIDVKGKRVFLSGPMTGMPSYNVAAYADVCDRAMTVMHECEVTYGVLRCEECELWEERE